MRLTTSILILLLSLSICLNLFQWKNQAVATTTANG